MNWYLKVLRQYADFNGRARRKEYWYFVLFNLLVIIALSFVDTVVGSSFMVIGQMGNETGVMVPNQVGLLTGIYSLGVLIPSIAVAVRRLHDTGRTGWWILIALIPLIGSIVLLIFYVLDSQLGTNQYGPNPKNE